MLGAETMLHDLIQQLVETVIENKDQLLKIFDRKIELKAPRHVILSDIRRDKPTPVLLNDVDHLDKLLPVAFDQLVGRDL